MKISENIRTPAKTEHFIRNIINKVSADIYFLCKKDFRRKDRQNRKPSGMRIIGDQKLLNIRLLCLKKKKLEAAAALLQHPTSRTEVMQAAVPACSPAAADTNRQTCDPTCAPRHSLRNNAATTRRSALLRLCPRCPKRGRSGEDHKSVAARVRALAAATAAAISSPAANSACSSACLRWLSRLQQRLLAAALAYSRACLCSSARLQQIEKQRFVSAPRKSLRTVRNRGFVRLIHTVHRRETAVALGPR